MKPTLLIATLSMALASPNAFAKSELEVLRSLCQEQKRQINELEQANERLRADHHEAQSPAAKTEPISSPDTAKPTAVTKPPTSPSTYTVKAGDNFDKIARKVGTKAEALAKLNGLKTSAIIHPGQKLKVPGSTAAATARATPAVAATTDSSPKNSGKTHKVQTGETLFSISKKHGMSTEAIVAANPKVKASSLRPGQVVSIGRDAPATTMISAPARAKAEPVVEKTSDTSSTPALKAATASTTATPQTQPTPTAPAAEMDAPSTTAEKKIRPVTIEGEMTYGEFATKHGTNAERLNALNGLDLTTATVLAKGSELYVPAQP